ncbi:unnamed protein product [Echinostoma caproni]|uniref:NopRA1 domain-containing protein n=1 Tax=Echinostoma caproni TaxID=27848 RepID=A0A183A377_9TREM|nr:unnamed protein product [Echinostoma caproni]
MLSAAREALLESLASIILLPSDMDADVLRVFQNLLIYPDGNDVFGQVTHSLCGSRGKTYLWLSYCLFCLICSTQLTEVLNQLVHYCKQLLKSPNWTISGVPFYRLLLYMAIVLINKVHATNGPLYYESMTAVLCDPMLPLDRVLLPAWFTEIIQRVQLASLPSPGERHDLCVALVENYGPLLIPSFCRSLFALGDRFLARSLCSIGRLDKPDSEAFWLLFGSLMVNEPANSSFSERFNPCQSLIEVFSEAVTAVSSSTGLWRQYIQAVISSGLDAGPLHKRAKELGIGVVLEHADSAKQKTNTVNQKSAKSKARFILGLKSDRRKRGSSVALPSGKQIASKSECSNFVRSIHFTAYGNFVKCRWVIHLRKSQKENTSPCNRLH